MRVGRMVGGLEVVEEALTHSLGVGVELRHCVTVAEAEREGVGVAQCVPVRLPVGECEAVTERVAQAEGEKLTVPLPLSVPDTLLLPLAL